MQGMPATASQVTAPPAASASQRLAIPAKVGGLLKAAMTALQQSRWADAVELTAAAAVQDIQHENITFLASAAGAGVIGELYENAFRGAGLTPAAKQQSSKAANEAFDSAGSTPTPQDPSPKTRRVLYIHPGLSPGQAATDRLLNVVERHNASANGRVRASVLCTEEFTARVPVLRHLEWPHTPSGAHSAALSRLRAAGAPLTIVQPFGSYLDAARTAVDATRDLNPDIAVFIASGACPIQAAMAYARVAPVQINQNIGSPLIIPGVDAVIYRNPAKRRDDDAELARRRIEAVELPASGTDLDAADAAAAIPRSALGVPPDAVLFVTAGNKVPERLLAGTFARDLAAFLKQHPKAWWMGIGRGDFTRALEPFRSAGVHRRVVLAGPQTDIRPHLKAADAYLNEYPEGGSNTILESMACGVPVIACAGGAAGDSHCAGIGAEIVSDDACTRETYWALASQWYTDSASRASAAERAHRRAKERFGFDALVNQYEELYERLASSLHPNPERELADRI
jgi:glycosyltransferase involved in cell wall biosynthesis